MGKALLVVIAVVLVVYSFFDLLATPKDRVRFAPKFVWIVLVLLVPFVGPLAWIVLGTRRIVPPPPPGRGRPGPRGPRGPDDDPDYLRGI
ncbi:hypothetical protein HMPREF0063_12622 [Aeromicrobium marinum DSM 15272]|uniref:Cardiolipin synthase N-terminal domain-containing protein n=1 Tax=Aeromicrobium marinum DSM 15272 TaxID=585531 RepID=E2SF13_9ACTN|nr:PLDc N-terminal domain-containing protein [Aeromicrobium marinum]EFQ82257.1 hypothetical protein HMPREF0063_12622 [Aeromicrobium marinum DSM 15272]